MTLTEQLQDLKGTILAHRRGESGVFRALFYCPLVICVPAATGFTVSALFLLNPPPMLGRILWISAICGTACGFAWWLWGLLQSVHRLLSAQRTFSALVLFVPFLYFGLQFVTEMLPDMSSEVAKNIVDPRDKVLKAQEKEDAWIKQPWIVTPHWDSSRLIAHGDIGAGSAAALRTALSKYPGIRLLEVDSYGGLINEEIQIIDIVKKRQLDTLVLNRCASACTGVFLAGERRYLSEQARFGFHQSGYPGRPKDTQWDTAEYMTSSEFYERGVSKEFTDQALNTSYYDLWKPRPFEVKRSGFATAWWSQRPADYR